MTTTRPQFFERIGKRDVLDKMIAETVAAGATVEEDKEKETIKVFAHSRLVMFKALHKGDGDWLVLLSREFYDEAAFQDPPRY